MAEISDPDVPCSLFCNYLCNAQLNKDSIIELRLGLPVTESILCVINALIIQEPLQFLEEIYRSLRFREEQMKMLLKRKIDSYKDIEEEAHKREEHYQIEIKELQSICENLKNKNESLLNEINEKEKTLNELKQAYLEKSNQKENIENMYTALRSQIHSNTTTNTNTVTSTYHPAVINGRNNNNNSSNNGIMMIPLRDRMNYNNVNSTPVIMNRSYNNKIMPTPSRSSFEIENNNNMTSGRRFLRTNFSMVRPSTPSIQKHFGSMNHFQPPPPQQQQYR